ncbi:MAG: hypothetical protein HY236_01175 [Acidobacteria bacterium]|nr:hypothetical protein [Acidobacteriota bacterium]
MITASLAPRRLIPLLVWPGLILFVLLSYFQFPGHRYLESDTQIYVPMFERFRDPALLSRDPMVVRAHTAFTLYDELTLGLARVTGWDFEAVLGAEHMVIRLALLAGIFLITRAMGLSDALALACAGVYALGGWVSGPSVLLMEYEPVPRAFALGPLVLGVGLAAHRRYLAAGIVGSAGFLLHPTTAGPFWTVFAVLLFIPDRPEQMKARLWGFVSLGVAAVGLKVAAALQPGVTEPQAFLVRIDEPWEQLLRLRASYVFVSMWPPVSFWQYGMMLAAAAPAYLRLRGFIQPTLRFFLVGLAALGVLSLPFSYLLLEKLKWAMLPQAQPTRAILFLELFTILLAQVMAFELACREKRLGAACWWAAATFAVGVETRLLFVIVPLALAWLVEDRWRWSGVPLAVAVAWLQPFGLVIWRGEALRQLMVCLVLGALLAAAAMLSVRRRAIGAAAVVAVTVSAFYFVPGQLRTHWSGQRPDPEMSGLCHWVRANTDIQAVFLFPDAGRGQDPGVFRARAGRALYVDWKGGGQMNFFHDFARLWWSRWQETMAEPFRPDSLPRFRELGIDYVVLSSSNRLTDRRPVFENGKYLVYRVK